MMGKNGSGIMYQRKLEKDIRCPLEYGMELFGGKWNFRIICVLHPAVQRTAPGDGGTSPMRCWPPH